MKSNPEMKVKYKQINITIRKSMKNEKKNWIHFNVDKCRYVKRKS